LHTLKSALEQCNQAIMNSKQLQAIEYLASGKRIEEVYSLIGVSRRTIYIWFKRDDFLSALEARKRDAIKSLSMKLISLNGEALEVLRDSLHSKNEAHRIRSASVIIARLYDATEISIIQDEIERINERIDKLLLKQEIH